MVACLLSGDGERWWVDRYGVGDHIVMMEGERCGMCKVGFGAVLLLLLFHITVRGCVCVAWTIGKE